MAKNTTRNIIIIAALLFAILYLRGNFLGVIGEGEHLCYQEFANVGTECGGLSSGTYSTDVDSYFVTYDKPQDATGALWQVKFGITGSSAIRSNVTIPSSCWNAFPDKVMLNMFSDGGGGSSDGRCFDGNEWIIITERSVTGSGPGESSNALNPIHPIDGNWNSGAYYSSVANDWTDSPGPTGGLEYRYWYEEGIWWQISLACTIPGDGLVTGVCDDIVNRAELGAAITQWINGDLSRSELSVAIEAWISG